MRELILEVSLRALSKSTGGMFKVELDRDYNLSSAPQPRLKTKIVG